MVTHQSHTLNETANEINEVLNQIAVTLDEISSLIHHLIFHKKWMDSQILLFQQQIIQKKWSIPLPISPSILENMKNIYYTVEGSSNMVQKLEKQTNEITIYFRV